MAQLLEGLVGRAVAVVETQAAEIDEEIDDSLLWPEEAAALGAVVEKRRWDYVSGRRCARLAIAALGCDPEPVLVGPRREPVWPDGLVGSITHTRAADERGYAAAMVARRAACLGLGVDAEPDAALPRGIVDDILQGPELEWAATTTAVAHPGRLVFCAKEAAYKVWYPMSGRWLGFDDVRVEIDSDACTFRVETLAPEPLRPVSGSYRIDQGLIVAAIEVPPRA